MTTHHAIGRHLGAATVLAGPLGSPVRRRVLGCFGPIAGPIGPRAGPPLDARCGGLARAPSGRQGKPGPSKSATTSVCRPTAQGGTSGLLKAFAGGTGTGASQGPRRQRRAGRQRLYRDHHHLEEVRDHPPRAGERQREGFFDRAGAAGRSGPHRRHRRASEKRALPHDRLDDPRAGKQRSALAGGLPHRHRHFRRAGCATT